VANQTRSWRFISVIARCKYLIRSGWPEIIGCKGTLAELRHREIVVGFTGPSTGSTIGAQVLGPLTGITFKIVTSYPGLAEVRLAAERGEVDGHCGLQVSAIKSMTERAPVAAAGASSPVNLTASLAITSLGWVSLVAIRLSR
jgi:hypothetical protein